ncbi:MAG: ribosome silencing factor [Longimicrobiales bacterium]|nr:ribosome silencing factor [Longimicrobiales bacterium]
MKVLTRITPEELPAAVRRAGEAALERKAQDVIGLDLRGISSATDHFLLASGTSDIQVKAISDHILEVLRDDGVRPSHVEGLETGRWVLMDFIDFVVHIFHPQARTFYQLEALWGDAPRCELTDEPGEP